MGISVLYVDDEESLRDIASSFLGLEPDFQVVTVPDAENALTLLNTDWFDVIVSDYQMPIMDGLEFLSVLSARHIEIPVILFTGRGREEVAIEAFNRGAIFYVQKGFPVIVQFSELVHKIRIAVDRDRTKKSLIASEQRFRSFFTHSLLGCAILDPEYYFIEVNDHLSRILGYERKELIGKSFGIILQKTGIMPGSKISSLIRHEKVSGHIEIAVFHRNGRIIDSRIAIAPILELDRITGYSLLIDDISEEKSAEEIHILNERRLLAMNDLHLMKESSEEELFTFFIKRCLDIIRSPAGFLILRSDESVRIVSSIGRTINFSQYTHKNSDQNLYHTLLNTELWNDTPSIHEGGRKIPYSISHLVPDPNVFRLMTVPSHEDGIPNMILVVWNKERPYTKDDIQQASTFLQGFNDFLAKLQSDRELKVRYEELVDSWNLVAEQEESIRTVLNALDDNGLLMDPQGTILAFNQRAIDTFQITQSQIPSNLCDLVPPESARVIRKGIENALTSGDNQIIQITEANQTFEWSIHPVKGIRDYYGRLVLFCRDITFIREMEEELELSQERYRQFTEFLPQSLFELDATGKIQYLNPHARQVFEIPDEEDITTRNFVDAVAVQNENLLVNRFNDAINGQIGKIFEANLVRQSGETFPALIQSIPIYQKGKIVGLRGIVMDLSEIRREEHARRDLEDKYRTVIENSREIIIVSQEGLLKFINPLGAKLTGYSLEELIGKPFSQFIHPGDQDLVYQHYLKRLNGQNYIEDYIFRFIDRLGSIHWVKSNAIRIIWEGKPATLNMLSEISDLILAQEALSESKRFLSSILEFLPDPIFAVDSEGKIIFWNQALVHLLKTQPGHFKEQNKDEISTILYGEKHPLLVDLLDHQDLKCPDNYRIIQWETNSVVADVNIPASNGKSRCLWGKATHLYDHSGHIIGAIESIRDITDRKLIEEHLKSVNDKLNLFSSITRHDIRNQLAVILIAVDRLLDPSTGEQVHKNARMIDETVSRIVDFIELTREYQEIGVSDPVWKPVLKTFTNAISGMQVPLRIEGTCHKWSTIKVYSDPLLEKVFYNIVDNAVKHAIGFTAITFGCRETGNGLILYIEDNGPGIKPDEKDKIFTKGHGTGTGLGLFLVREILGITGMEISETGTYGEGTRFEIFVPHGRYHRVKNNHDPVS